MFVKNENRADAAYRNLSKFLAGRCDVDSAVTEAQHLQNMHQHLAILQVLWGF